MKQLHFITAFLMISISMFGQKNDEKKTTLKSCAGATFVRQFEVGDSVITCNTCHWDACGNVINTNSDTLFRNHGLVYPGYKSLYLTIDSILLTKKDIHALLDGHKIKHMQFLHCNDVASRMGFLALEGLYLVQLRDTVIATQLLTTAVNEACQTKNITASQILVEGYRLAADKTKYPKQEKLNIIYLEKSDLYNVLTE